MDGWELADAVGNGIDRAFLGTGEMVTKWVTVVEVMDNDGQRWRQTLIPRDASYWDTVGLLIAASDEQRAMMREQAP